MNLQLPAGFLATARRAQTPGGPGGTRDRATAAPGRRGRRARTDFLPDFCRGELVFNVAVVAELLALVITLVMPRDFLTPSAGRDLLVISLFVQWVALGGTATLCYTRRAYSIACRGCASAGGRVPVNTGRDLPRQRGCSALAALGRRANFLAAP